MKKITILFALGLLFANVSLAQKWGYVDTQQILEKLPEYQNAQKEIDNASQKWEKELEEMYAKVEKLYKDYTAEEVLLPEDVKKERQEEIFEAERTAKEFKASKWGLDGELYKLQDEKIKPIQQKVYDAIETVAKTKRLDFIVDISTNTGIIYKNSVFDRTADVMKQMNLSSN